MSKPLIRRVETVSGHYYLGPDDKPVVGVTTVLNSMKKGALEKWAIKKAVSLALEGESAWKGYTPSQGTLVDWLSTAGEREANIAATIGTNSHNFAEAHMTGQEPDFEALGKKEQKHAKCYLDFVEDYQPEPILVEKVLVYIDPKTNYPLFAGSMDLIAKLTWNDVRDHSRLPADWVDGETYILDYKASASQPRPSHALQMSAYRACSHYLDDDGQLQEMVPVDHAAVILLNGGKGQSCYRMIKLDTGPVVFHVFKCLLTISNFSKIEDRCILGSM